MVFGRIGGRPNIGGITNIEDVHNMPLAPAWPTWTTKCPDAQREKQGCIGNRGCSMESPDSKRQMPWNVHHYPRRPPVRPSRCDGYSFGIGYHRFRKMTSVHCFSGGVKEGDATPRYKRVTTRTGVNFFDRGVLQMRGRRDMIGSHRRAYESREKKTR